MAQKFPTPPAYSEFRLIEDGHLMPATQGRQGGFCPKPLPADRGLVLAIQGATESAILSTPINKAAWHSKPSWFAHRRQRSHDRA